MYTAKATLKLAMVERHFDDRVVEGALGGLTLELRGLAGCDVFFVCCGLRYDSFELANSSPFRLNFFSELVLQPIDMLLVQFLPLFVQLAEAVVI